VPPVASPAEAAPTPTPTPAPAAEAAPAPAATPATDAPTSILSEAITPKSVEAPAATPPAEVAPPAPVAPPTYESFKLPEGVALEEAKVGEFTKMLGEFEVANKADHAQVQAFGQRMVDLFIAEQQRQQNSLVESFTKIRDTWKSEIKADPVFGGDKYTETVKDAGRLIQEYGGTAEEIASLQHMLRITGAGDHPGLIKLIARAGATLAKEGKPVPAIVPKSPATISKSSRRYAASLNGNGAS
jgi:hypothetical protein